MLIHQVVTSDGRALYLYDLEGGPPRKVVLPGKEGWSYPFMSPEGTEVWVLNGDSRTLLRYKLP